MRKIFAIFLICLSFSLSLTLTAFADDAANVGNGKCDNDPSKQCVKLANPLGEKDVSTEELIGRIINAALGVIGTITLVMFIWGGSSWLLSMGNPEKIKSGADTMLWAAIGLAVVFLSYFISKFIIGYLTAGAPLK